jgi:DNA-binding NtrC family response regulator
VLRRRQVSDGTLAYSTTRRSSNSTRSLVVDDDSRLRDLLVRYLGEQGFEVKAVGDAADGQAALTASITT